MSDDRCDCLWDGANCPHCGSRIIDMLDRAVRGHKTRCHRASVGAAS